MARRKNPPAAAPAGAPPPAEPPADTPLTPTAAGAAAAAATGRARPFTPATVRKWARDGALPTTEENGRVYVPFAGLMAWLRERFGADETEATPARNPRRVRLARDARDRQRHELEDVDCPSCGRTFDVTPATVVAECPRCGAALELLDDDADGDSCDCATCRPKAGPARARRS